MHKREISNSERNAFVREKKYSVLSPKIADYVSDLLALSADRELEFVLERAKKGGTPPLHVIPSDGRHLEILSRSVNAQNMVEIGTLCGYSAVCLARSLNTPQGKLYTCERSEHHARIAKETFSLLGLDNKIELVFGDALSNLEKLSHKGPFDLVFIDADKENYPHYFHWAMENLRTGGLLLADNVFLFDYIQEEQKEDGKLKDLIDAMKNFNAKCANHPKLRCTFLPTGEGLMVAVKVP